MGIQVNFLGEEWQKGRLSMQSCDLFYTEWALQSPSYRHTFQGIENELVAEKLQSFHSKLLKLTARKLAESYNEDYIAGSMVCGVVALGTFRPPYLRFDIKMFISSRML